MEERTRDLELSNQLLKNEILERTRLEAEARKAKEIADEAKPRNSDAFKWRHRNAIPT